MDNEDNDEKCKMNRLERIDYELRSGTYPNSEGLASKLNVTSRTILRDIEILRLYYDAPIEYDPGKRGFFYSDSGFYLKSVMLTNKDFENISLYYEFSMKNESDEFIRKLRKILDKILIAAPADKTRNFPFMPSEKYPHDFLFAPAIIFDFKILGLLFLAIQKKTIIETKYWVSSNKKPVSYTLEPLYVCLKTDPCYLLACNNDRHDKPEVFFLNRLSELHATDKHFKKLRQFKVADYIREEPRKIFDDSKNYLFELSFPKEIAPEARERTYHFNEATELCKDGTFIVSFTSTRLHEVFHWVQKQGHKVKVLNPPELVSLVKREAQNTLRYYI